ncbi:MAG: SPOR domain-containing protein [Dysgonamonadaceae bacterium]|jgi:cell division protein FtsN|nr:SPOR domain-containing protein [Dysgonamonadaceae bacterium]
MNYKTGLLLLTTILFAVIFTSCKTKESAYKAAYERAKAKEMQEQAVEDASSVYKSMPTTTTTTPVNTEVTIQKEKITSVDGSELKKFSVVIGSYMSKTNASSLKERMQAEGYDAILAKNEKDMYRVIIATFDNKQSAANERDAFKAKKRNEDPDFQKAWILEKQN